MTTNYGDNPQQPSLSAEAFIPDQLIAGGLKLVTETVTITGGAALKRGSVLGKILLASALSAAKSGGNTGGGALTLDSTTPVLAGAIAGIYTARLTVAAAVIGTHSGLFEVRDPNGNVLGEVQVGNTFADQIKFAIAYASADFIVGDGFDITVAAGSGFYKLAALAATDGSQKPRAILADDADASGGDVTSGVYQMGEFNSNALTFGAAMTAALAKDQLRALGIFLKSAVSAADPT